MQRGPTLNLWLFRAHLAQVRQASAESSHGQGGSFSWLQRKPLAESVRQSQAFVFQWGDLPVERLVGPGGGVCVRRGQNTVP